MDYKDLQSFISLASMLHLGRAAEQLHMSPSTLSRRLARMEQEVGAPLISRVLFGDGQFYGFAGFAVAISGALSLH